jgi:hypothetical protein
MGRNFHCAQGYVPGSYRLQYLDRQEVPNTWNIEHLRRFHP